MATAKAIKEAEANGENVPRGLGLEDRAPDYHSARTGDSKDVAPDSSFALAAVSVTSSTLELSKAGSTYDLSVGRPQSHVSAFQARLHQRSVMPNVGFPLHEVENLSVAFSALADAVHACRLLCLAGYNHRDLSTGNIIVEIQKQHGRLGDLEFAKLHGISSASASHDVRAGTPHFMATEVLDREYAFGPSGRGSHRSLPFRHNAGHDLESILWIATFMLYNSLVFEPGDERGDLKRLTRDRFYERAIVFNYERRERIFIRRGLSAVMDHHVKSNRAVAIAIDHVERMEKAIKAKYDEFEAKLNNEDRGEKRNREFFPVHDVFEQTLREMSDLFKGKDFVYIGAGRAEVIAQEEDNVAPAAKRRKLGSGRKKETERKP